MISFSGFGFLLLPIFAVMGLFAGVVSERLLGTDEAVSVFVGGLVAAGLTWRTGTVLNDPAKDRVTVDPKTGAQVKSKRRHKLFFIPIQYYAIPFLVLGGLSAVGLESEQNTATDGEQHAASQSHSYVSTATVEPRSPPNTATSSGQDTASAAPPTPRPTQPADAPGTFSWTVQSEKDRMSGEVKKKAVGEVEFPDGTTVQGDVTCDPVGLIFALSTFQGSTAVDFPWQGETTTVRTRVDQQNTRTLALKGDYLNSVSFMVYDPEVLKVYVGEAVGAQMPKLSNSNGPGAGLLGLATAGAFSAALDEATAKAEATSVGKLADFPRMQSILVELALANKTTNVVQINPGQASLQAFASECSSSLRRH